MPLKLFRRKGSANWHFRGKAFAKGRRLRGSTGTDNKERANEIVEAIAAREHKGHIFGPEAVTTFGEAATLYLNSEKPERFVKKLVLHWKDTLIRDIVEGDITAAALTLYPNCGGATRNRQVIVPACAIINYAAKKKLCHAIKVERFPYETKAKTPATWLWVSTFMSASSPHLGALACFMFLTGARVSEATSLCWTDVDLGAGRALIRQTKIGAERYAHLPPVLVVALANICRDQAAKTYKSYNPYNSKKRSDRVFGYASRDTARPMWDKTIERAGIKALSFHAMRHGFATSMLQAGVDPVTIAKLGGWKDTAQLFKTYGHANEDDTLADLIAGPVTPGMLSTGRVIAKPLIRRSK